MKTIAPHLPTPDRTVGLLSCLHRWLGAGAGIGETPELFLGELRAAFAAHGVGVKLDAGLVWQAWETGLPLPPPSNPWMDDPQFRPTSAATVKLRDQSWLVAPLDEGDAHSIFLWVCGPLSRSWTEAEKAALGLAGQIFMQAAMQAPPTSPTARWYARSRQQQRLEQMAHVTGRLAHDMGNILTGLLGFSELTLQHVNPSTLAHRYLGEVRQAAQYGAAWVRKLQWFSRRPVAPVTPSQLGEALTHEAGRVRPLWSQSVELRIDLEEDLPPVAVDAEALQQALGQLLDNAHEAIPGSGVVTVAARVVHLSAGECLDLFGRPRPGKHVEISVTDDGVGLSQDAQQRILREMLFSTKPRQRGLGLAVVYGVARGFYGALRWTPQPERGAVVRLYFPVAGPIESPPIPVVHKPSACASILVVDDDPMVLAAVDRILGRAGYRVQTAPAPQEGLAAWPRARFDLVISDLAMPEMSGWQLARRILDRDPGANFLFISSHGSCHEPDHDDLVKRFDLLQKPFEPASLLEAVQAALVRRSAPARNASSSPQTH